MNKYQIFIALFYVLDAEYDECKDERLGNYLSGMNPFLFKGEGSADPAIYSEFSSIFKTKIGTVEEELEYNEAYDFVKCYLGKINNTIVLNYFLKTSKDTWINTLSETEN